MEQCEVFIKVIEATFSRRRFRRWTASPRLAPVLTFLVHIMHCFVNMFKEAALLEKCQNLLLLQRFDKW